MRHLRNSLLAIALGAAIAGIQLSSVQAHVLESDGPIAAVLHMPPDDSPQAGQITSLDLAFASSEPNFDIKNYTIIVTIKQSDTTILEKTLVADNGSSHDGTADVTLPEAGAYQLAVDGKPLNGGRSFRLSYSIRASAAANSTEATNTIGGVSLDFWVLNLGIIAMYVLVVQYQIRVGGRYAAEPAASTNNKKPSQIKTPVQH